MKLYAKQVHRSSKSETASKTEAGVWILGVYLQWKYFFIAFSKSLFWGLNGCKSVPDIGKSQVQGCLRLNTNYVPFAYLILN